jgi:hypothetical protein
LPCHNYEHVWNQLTGEIIPKELQDGNEIQKTQINWLKEGMRNLWEKKKLLEGTSNKI